jgi:hypothetical protein
MMQRAIKSDSTAIGIIHKGTDTGVLEPEKYHQCRYGDDKLSFRKSPLKALPLATSSPTRTN